MTNKRFGHLQSNIDAAQSMKDNAVQQREQKRSNVAPSRQGKEQLSAYVSAAMKKAVKIAATKHDITVERLIIEALDDKLRELGESPIGG